MDESHQRAWWLRALVVGRIERPRRHPGYPRATCARRRRVTPHHHNPVPRRGGERVHYSRHPSGASARGIPTACRQAENPQRGFRCSRAWALAGCRRLPGSKRRFQCRCRRDPSGCRLGEANQDAVFQRVIMGRGEGGPRIEAHGPAARREAMACVSALPIDRRRPYRRRRPGARIQPG